MEDSYKGCLMLAQMFETEENFDEFDESRVHCHNFPYQLILIFAFN